MSYITRLDLVSGQQKHQNQGLCQNKLRENGAREVTSMQKGQGDVQKF